MNSENAGSSKSARAHFLVGRNQASSTRTLERNTIEKSACVEVSSFVDHLHPISRPTEELESVGYPFANETLDCRNPAMFVGESHGHTMDHL